MEAFNVSLKNKPKNVLAAEITRAVLPCRQWLITDLLLLLFGPDVKNKKSRQRQCFGQTLKKSDAH